MAGYSHRTAQPPILAVFLPWGVSAGAGRVRPAVANVGQNQVLKKCASHFANLTNPALNSPNYKL